MNETLYIHRDVSLLAFNKRVLAEAERSNNRILDRLKFIAIVASNTEEFFMVRMAALNKQTERTVHNEALLHDLRIQYKNLVEKQYAICASLFDELAQASIRIISDYYTAAEFTEQLESYFLQDILPVLTPISIGPTHPFPHLVSGRIYLAVSLAALPGRKDKIEKTSLSFIEVPSRIFGRFLMPEENVFVPIEYLIMRFIPAIYSGYTVTGVVPIHVTRDADLRIEEENVTDLMSELETTIKRMHTRNVVRAMYTQTLPDAIKTLLVKKTHLRTDDMYSVPGLLLLQDCMELYATIDRNDLKNKPTKPLYPDACAVKDIFKRIAERSIVLYHPFHSYKPVVDLLDAAADDPFVLAIKQTLYRSNADSGVIKALIRAAENGKHVSVVVELTARFDEQRNIEWAKKLEEAGAHVVYGLAGLKTHAKCLLIIRKEKKGIAKYVHMATGNYNERTAELYGDVSLFTSDSAFGADASMLFNLLTGFSFPTDWFVCSVAPFTLRRSLINLIRRESGFAEKGMNAHIILKMNSLEDQEITDELYNASHAGVRIDLIVRGICILRPGLPGVSETITVNSIIGSYLEHARIFYFHNAGSPELYCASADCMTRNLDRRVELMFPVTEVDSKAFLLEILTLQMADSENRWKLNAEGVYKKVKSDKKNDSFVTIAKMVQSKEAKRSTIRNIVGKKKGGRM